MPYHLVDSDLNEENKPLLSLLADPSPQSIATHMVEYLGPQQGRHDYDLYAPDPIKNEFNVGEALDVIETFSNELNKDTQHNGQGSVLIKKSVSTSLDLIPRTKASCTDTFGMFLCGYFCPLSPLLRITCVCTDTFVPRTLLTKYVIRRPFCPKST